MTFAILCFAGILATALFAIRALQSGHASDTVGLCFGIALVVASFLTLSA